MIIFVPGVPPGGRRRPGLLARLAGVSLGGLVVGLVVGATLPPR